MSQYDCYMWSANMRFAVNIITWLQYYYRYCVNNYQM